MKTIITITVILSLVTVQSVRGVSPTELLKLTTGARTAGMGGANCALADDPDMLQYNIAGLGFINGFQANLQHLSYFFNTAFEHIAYIAPFKKGGFGVSASLFHLFFDNDFQIIDGKRGEKFNIYDMLLTGGYGYKYNNNLSFGAGVKFIRSNLHSYYAHVFGFDLGCLYKNRVFHAPIDPNDIEAMNQDNSDLRVGAALQNIGGEIKYNTGNDLEGDSLPLTIRLGIGVLPFKFVTLLYEPAFIFDNNDFVFRNSMGMELLKGFYVQPRIGYIWEMMDVIKRGHLTFGAGFQFQLHSLFYRADYAYRFTDVKDIAGNNQYFSLTIGSSTKIRKLFRYYQLPRLSNIVSYIDYLEAKEKETEKIEKMTEVRKIYRIKVDAVDADKRLKEKGYHDFLYIKLKQLFKQDERYIITNRNLDVIFDVNMSIEGEILAADFIIRSPADKELKKEPFEFFSELAKEFKDDYKKLNIIITDKDKPPVLVPIHEDKSKKEKDKDFENLEKTARNMKTWVDNNIEDSLKAQIKIKVNTPDVMVFINGKYFETIGREKELSFRLYPDKYTLRFMKEYFLEKTIEVTAGTGDKKDFNINLQEGKFYVDVNINSFPAGVTVVLDGKTYGKTPTVLKKIENGEHVLKYTHPGGWKQEQKIELSQEGTYSFYNVWDYKDNFSTLNTKFWRSMVIDETFDVGVRKKSLSISGKIGDHLWEENGVVSPLFYAENLKISIDLQKKDKKGKAVFGIVDKNGHGFGVGYDGRYYDYVVWEENSSLKFVSALDLREKEAPKKITIQYNDGLVTAYIEDYKLVSRKVAMENLLRVMIIGDGKVQGDQIAFSVDNFALENR